MIDSLAKWLGYPRLSPSSALTQAKSSEIYERSERRTNLTTRLDVDDPTKQRSRLISAFSGPKHWDTNATYHPRISIVVSVFSVERASDLLVLVNAVESQNLQDTELVVVVEGALPVFNLLVSRFKNQNSLKVRLVSVNYPLGVSGARNLGVSCASGDIISFVDDDACICENWKSAILTVLEQHPGAIGVVGSSIPMWENPQDSWFPEEFYWMIGCSGWTGWAGPGRVRHGWGVDMSFRRTVFNKCQFSDGFSRGGEVGKTGPVGDDTDFCYRATQEYGAYLLYEPGVCVTHHIRSKRLSFGSLMRYAYWQGHAEATFRSRPGLGNLRGASRAGLARRILSCTIPAILRDFLLRPRVGLKKASLLVLVVVCFHAGWLSQLITPVGRTVKQALPYKPMIRTAYAPGGESSSYIILSATTQTHT